MAYELSKDCNAFFLMVKQIKTGKIKLQLFFQTWEIPYPITQHNIPKDFDCSICLIA